MHIYNIDISQTASSGSWSFNTKKFNSVLLKQIIMEPATFTPLSSATTYDVEITDPNGLIVFTTETKWTGKYREQMEIPLKGIHTIAVNN